MSLLVLECGASSFEPVKQIAFRLASTYGDYSILALFGDENGCRNFGICEWSLERALEEVAKGHADGAMVTGGEDEEGFFQVYRPYAGGDALSMWYLYHEWKGSPSREILEPFKRQDGLVFVSLALEDTVDLDQLKVVTVQSFPWDHWRLLHAAVRREDLQWVQAEGAALRSAARPEVL